MTTCRDHVQSARHKDTQNVEDKDDEVLNQSVVPEAYALQVVASSNAAGGDRVRPQKDEHTGR